METFRRVLNYLARLEWKELKQHVCLFCDRKNFEEIVYDDEEIIAIKNRTAAGKHHWLLMPISPPFRHIRDIEALEAADIPLLTKFEKTKQRLLSQHCADVSPSDVHSGYHRGRRVLIGNIYYPDTISIHHIHLHIIVEPRPLLKFFKYPPWLPLMWKSDRTVMAELQRKKERQL
ncbi:hypothetical protein BKA63DRAFT_248056 [Paraphoma chrysanthemicola]|nr:hypothetical protein BKA63DRAFT_248056 [Paraphoma chrysanthemicola]